MIEKQLRQIGLDADLVGDGESALRSWESAGYALLITDLNLTGMNGLALAAAIRSGEARDGAKSRPIILLTADETGMDEAVCRAAGISDRLVKPLSLADLRSALEKWLPPVVDVGTLACLVGNDRDTVSEFLQAFLDHARSCRSQMTAAWAAGSAIRIRDLAHKLKSSARSVGAAGLAEICASIESCHCRDSLDALLMAFGREIAAIERGLPKLIAGR